MSCNSISNTDNARVQETIAGEHHIKRDSQDLLCPHAAKALLSSDVLCAIPLVSSINPPPNSKPKLGAQSPVYIKSHSESRVPLTSSTVVIILCAHMGTSPSLIRPFNSSNSPLPNLTAADKMICTLRHS